MPAKRQLLFVQGGGRGAHDEWDRKLVESLQRELGAEYEIRYPRMPDEDDPSYASWKAALEMEWERLRDGAILVGHSVGGTILVGALAERPPSRESGRATMCGSRPTWGRAFPKASPSISITGSRTTSCRRRTWTSTHARFRRLASTGCRGATISSTMT